MKLRRLHFPRFGCFTDHSLDFNDTGRSLHVIYGPNEAGKSTALRGLFGLLYGIPARTQDAHLHDMKDLRVMAELEHSDGRRSTFVRRKGARDTLLDTDAKTIPETLLLGFLGGVGEDIFNTMYRLDHRLLIRGGEELLNGKGDVAESLFQAGTGLTGLRRTLDAIEEEAEVLFKLRSTTATISRQLTAYDEARRRSRDLSTPGRQWSEQSTVLRSKEAELGKHKADLAELRAKMERLGRFKLAIPLIARRKELFDELAPLRSTPSLPETATKEREEAQRHQQQANASKDRALNLITKLRDDRDQLSLPLELLAQADGIASASEQLNSYRQALVDLPKIRAQQVQLDSDALGFLKDVRPELSLDDAPKLHLTIMQRTRIRALASGYGMLQERLRISNSRMATLTNDAADKAQLLGEAALPTNTTDLQRALERVRKLGNLEASLSDANNSHQRVEQRATVALKQLTLWSGPLDQLESMSVPLLETVERFDAEFSILAAEQRGVATHIDENLATTRRIDGEIQALQLGGAIPTDVELHQARRRRDEGWSLVRRAWLEDAADPAQQKAFDPDRPLESAYEHSVVSADAVADRLRAEAERVAKLAGLTADIEAADKRSNELESKQADLANRMHIAQQSWQEVWQSTGIVPLSPKEMRSWLVRHAALVGLAGEGRETSRVVRQLEDRITKHTDELSGALEELGELPHQEAETLSVLIQRAEEYLDSQRAIARQRVLLKGEIDRLAAEQSTVKEEHEGARRDLENWQREWRDAIAPLHLADDGHVENVSAALETLDSMSRKMAESENLRPRLESMQSHINQFTVQVASLVRLLPPELRNLPPDQALGRLQNALTTARQDAERLRGLETRIKEQQEAIEAAESEHKQYSDVLDTLMRRANSLDVVGLDAAEQNSARARELQKLLDEANRTLAGFSAGASLETFLAEAGGVNADQLPSEISELELEARTLEDQRSELEQDVGHKRAALQAIDGGNAAAIAAEEAQEALAGIRTQTQRFIRLRLASAVLRRHIDRFREQNQDPILRRAGEVFPRLTRNSFTKLTTGFDDKDRPVLLGVRASNEEVNVDGMSDGTRDQLFLALRLASLERQLAGSEPLPLVVDDVLVNFDDDRAAATLEILSETAQKTQILFFTHHTRLVELAERNVPEKILKVHRLDQQRA